MRDMLNVAFQNSWFGPFAMPKIYGGNPPQEPHPGPVYNDGPMDGLKEASMHAQWFAQIPLQSAFQARLAGAQPKKVSLGGSAPVFCPPGQSPVSTGVPGQSKCVDWSSPSAMITGKGPNTVSKMAPASYPNKRTFPVRPFFGFQES